MPPLKIDYSTVRSRSQGKFVLMRCACQVGEIKATAKTWQEADQQLRTHRESGECRLSQKWLNERTAPMSTPLEDYTTALAEELVRVQRLVGECLQTASEAAQATSSKERDEHIRKLRSLEREIFGDCTLAWRLADELRKRDSETG